MSQAKSRDRLSRLKKVVLRQRKIIILSAIILLLLVLGYFTLGLQAQFILEEEMYLDLTPLEASYTIPYDESVQVNFSLFVDAPNVCDFTCSHQFTDLSTGEVLDEKITSEKRVLSSYALNVSNRGEGQHLYSYQVVCHNIRSNLCATTEKNYFKSALISLNYDLPEAEAQAKERLEVDLEKAYQNFSELQSKVQETKTRAQLLVLESSAEQLEQNITKYFLDLEQAWSEQRFRDTQVLLEAIPFQALQQDVDVEYLRVKEVYERVQGAQLFLETYTSSRLQDYANVFAAANASSQFVDFIQELNQTRSRSYQFAGFFIAESFLKEIDLLRAQADFIEQQYDIFSKKKNLSLLSTQQEQQKIYDELAVNRTSSFMSCEELRTEQLFINETNALRRDAQLAFAPFQTRSFFSNFSEEFLSPQVNLSSYENVSNATTQINFSKYSPAFLAELVFIPEINSTWCAQTVSLPELAPSPSPLPQISSPTLELSVEEHEPLCCFDGECSACCTSTTCQELYPVIFVHGHALSEKNRPEESHSAFGKIQRLLEADGFINAGQLGPDSAFSLPRNEWGRVPAPITLRLSYYIITYVDVVGRYQIATQKTERIENYAIRLREMIETVKYRTGKEKVDIVAHSMGGLVVREYISLFGEDAVHKFVMVGTPNQGVAGRAERFCGLTGATKECEDLAKGSIFLQRLNRPENAFDTIDGYTIRATGCFVEGQDGDGIVPESSVPLNYTTNYVINGTCTDALNSDLHTRMLDPDAYPEVYELIRSILRS